MKKKKKSILPLVAMIFALAALAVSVLGLASVPEDNNHLFDDVRAENEQLKAQVQTLEDRVAALETQLEQLMTVVNLQSWQLDVTPWTDSTGADVSFIATPSEYQDGVTAELLVILDGKQVALEACKWDGSAFLASVSLNAADGYCYYCLLTTPTGTRQLALMTPDSPDAGAAVYLQSGLSAYCNLVVNDWIEDPGKSLVLTDAYAQVQLPDSSISGQVKIEKAEVVLRLNRNDSVRLPIKLIPSEVEGSWELVIKDLQIPMPTLKNFDNLELCLEVTLSDGRKLSAFGVAWSLEDGKLISAVG